MPTLIASSSIPDTATAQDVPLTKEQLASSDESLRRVAELQKFEAKPGESLVMANEDGIKVLLGLGDEDSVGVREVRLAGAALVRATKGHTVIATNLASALGADQVAAAALAAAESILQVSYRYSRYDESKAGTLEQVHVIGSEDVEAAVSEAVSVDSGVSTARDLVNEPGGSLVPERFAEIATSIGDDAGFDVEVWDEDRLVAESMGGILAVNKGSTHPPRLVIMRITPEAEPTAHVALVGKGITFDSGGLSLKTAAGMTAMKIDMAGGAAVLGAMEVLARLGTSVAVTAYVPLTDNMTGGDAQRPGDVFAARNGTTVEVLNTDAEGRLVLADALALAAEQEPDAIVDIATLTGSASVALGIQYAALMASDDDLAAKLEGSSQRTGENIWRLPLFDGYRPQLDSPVAQLKNIGANAYGGTIVAGLFLREFVAEVPWAHIDLGLSALSERDQGLDTKGATGFGVKLLSDMVRNWEA